MYRSFVIYLGRNVEPNWRAVAVLLAKIPAPMIQVIKMPKLMSGAVAQFLAHLIGYYHCTWCSREDLASRFNNDCRNFRRGKRPRRSERYAQVRLGSRTTDPAL
jgi:hypothetical protein